MIQIWRWLNQSGACRESYFFVKMFAKKAGHISAKKRPDVKESRSQCSAWSEGRKLSREVICGPLQSIRDAPIIYFTNFVVRCGCTVRGQCFRVVWVNFKCINYKVSSQDGLRARTVNFQLKGPQFESRGQHISEKKRLYFKESSSQCSVDLRVVN